VQPQLSFAGMPATLHMSLSAATADAVPEFLAALADAASAAAAAGPVRVGQELAAATAALEEGTLDDAAFAHLVSLAGLAAEDGTVRLPRAMAPVNALLDIASPWLREALLVAFLDHLTR